MKNLFFQNRQFLLYCVISLSGTTLFFGIYSLLLKTRLLDYQAANTIAYASGTLLTFILNARFNFRVTDRIARRLACFLGAALAGWSISTVVLYLLISDGGFNKYLSGLAALFAAMLVQYNLNRWFAFRKTN